MTYTGCVCDCHPEVAERVVFLAPHAVPVEIITPAAGEPTPRPVNPEHAARTCSWTLVAQGVVLGVLGAIVGVQVFVSPPTGGEASLAKGLGVAVAVGMIGLASLLLTFGLLARGRGLTPPVLGVLAHSFLALLAINALLGGAYVALEVLFAELVLLFSLFLGVPWWRSVVSRD